MKQETRKSGHPFFKLKHIPMDAARLVCLPLPLLMRIKRRTPEGEKYKTKLKGGAIVTANHTSFTDPFIVGVTFWYRRLFFLVAEIVMKGKLRSLLLKGVGAIKIDRNSTDIEAITKSVDTLKQGYLLTVFPQGGINVADEIDTVKSGAVLMALKAGVPIIPMHILPKAKWYSTRTVVIGNAIDPKEYCKKFPSTADIEKVTNMLAVELNRCKNANLINNKEN